MISIFSLNKINNFKFSSLLKVNWFVQLNLIIIIFKKLDNWYSLFIYTSMIFELKEKFIIRKIQKKYRRYYYYCNKILR